MQTSSKLERGRVAAALAWARSPRGRIIVQFTLIGLVLIFFAYTLVTGWGELSKQNLRLDYGYLALSAIPLIARPFLSAFGWWQIVYKLGGRLSIARSIHIYFISGLARYLPGPFLGSIGRAVMAEENGIEGGVAAISVLLELGLLVASGALIGLVWVAFTIGLANVTIYLIALGAGSLIILEPRVFLTLLNFLLTRFGRKPVRLNLHLGDMMQLIAPYLLNWLLNGLTFYLVVNAIFPVPSQFFNLGGIYITALTIAIFGLTFPDGWGIREFTLIKMLTALASIPSAVAVGLALFSRVWWMAAEALWVGLALLLRDGRKVKPAPNEVAQLKDGDNR